MCKRCLHCSESTRSKNTVWTRQVKEYPWYLLPSCIRPLKYRTISWETVGPIDIPTEGVYSPWTWWISDTNMQCTDPRICRFNAIHAGSDLNLRWWTSVCKHAYMILPAGQAGLAEKQCQLAELQRGTQRSMGSQCSTDQLAASGREC